MDIDALLDRHRDRFRKLLQTILSEESGEDPFSFPLGRFMTLSDDEKAELVRRADILARERVDRELEARGACWLVLVGDEIVLASTDPQAIPSVDEVLGLGEPRGLVAYLFEAPLIEELPGPTASWTPLEGSDRYPTISLCVGADTGVWRSSSRPGRGGMCGGRSRSDASASGVRRPLFVSTRSAKPW